ncbi:5918_t:CDS:1, partial [Acaulospora morrowiae]
RRRPQLQVTLAQMFQKDVASCVVIPVNLKIASRTPVNFCTPRLSFMSKQFPHVLDV